MTKKHRIDSIRCIVDCNPGLFILTWWPIWPLFFQEFPDFLRFLLYPLHRHCPIRHSQSTLDTIKNNRKPFVGKHWVIFTRKCFNSNFSDLFLFKKVREVVISTIVFNSQYSEDHAATHTKITNCYPFKIRLFEISFCA